MELKVKEVVCVIQRGAGPTVEICKSGFLRDTTFHHGGDAAEQRAIAIFRKNAVAVHLSVGARQLISGLSLSEPPPPRTPALWSHTHGGAAGGGTTSPLNTNETELGEERGRAKVWGAKLFISEDASSAKGVLTASRQWSGSALKVRGTSPASFLQTRPPRFAFFHGCVSATADCEHRSL